MNSTHTRLLKERIAKTILKISAIIVSCSLFFILGTIFYKGLPYLNLEMISSLPQGGFYIGKQGGILNAIMGSIYLACASTLLSALIGIPISIYLNVYIKRHALLAKTSKLLFDVLFGVPSIVYGAIAFSIMILLGIRASLLGGIITLTLLTIPILVRTLDEVISTIPEDLRNVTYSLGASKWQTARMIIKYIKPGLITALLLAFGRSIGDVAGVLLTTGFSDNLPKYLDEPAASLPLAIFFQLSSPIPEVQGRAFASAIILTFIILTVVLCSHLQASLLKKHKI